MKIFKSILLALLLGSSLSLVAQTGSYDTVSRPKSYPDKVNAFNADPVKKGDIVFLGNSITAGGDWKTLLSLPNAKNRGIGGDVTFGVLERLDEVIKGQPAKVFILIGINDLARRIPKEVIHRNHKAIVNRIREGSKKTKIYFYTLLPTNSTFDKAKNHYGKDNQIAWLNAEIKKFGAIKNVKVVDLYAHFVDADQRLKAELTYDGLHLNAEGYKSWAKMLQDSGYLK